ncbi:heat shock protein DnaJ-like protein [Calothrix sp. NIES-4071]|nr:heat shock protein DnaJ-like protein [Calothrix sp. NIES-4071]BAZ59922.1 heat shock protein DnaJ-like protein [Calothrix sp. NIES-4105]
MSRKSSPTIKRAPSTTTTATLAPSEVHLRLEGLEVEHQKLLKQIKKKRAELDKFIEQMRTVASEVFSRATPNFQKIALLNQEIHTIFNEIFKNKKLNKQNRKKVEEIYRTLQYAEIISPQPIQEEIEIDEQFNGDEDFNKSNQSHHQHYYYQSDSDAESPSAGRSESSKKIRHIFLRLAEIFHPDKASDSETQERHTEIMKEINRAYTEGDLARLLEIEQQYQVGEQIDSSSEDDLSRKCLRIEQQNGVLKTQFESLKRSLREAKKTPQGGMVTDFRKFRKQGVEPLDTITEQLEHQINIISQIRDYAQDFNQSRISVKDFLRGPEILRSLEREMMEELLEDMFDDFDGYVRY